MNANGENYAILTTLGLRHAFGGIQWTGTEESPLVWLKEISSDGNMNTVDVIFPAHPAYIYTNATILKLLLDPLFQNQEAGLYPNTYSMHDIGAHYPNATGYPAGNDEAMPLEESGNMIIMTLTYYAITKDTSYLEQHYKLLSQWAEYLVADALIPANQASTDDFEGALANQTNLATKGIVGIQAMSVIANKHKRNLLTFFAQVFFTTPTQTKLSISASSLNQSTTNRASSTRLFWKRLVFQ